MATKEDKYEDNAGGKYYCDTECIDCDLCRETAPENFTRNEDGGYSYVHKQPENEEEEAIGSGTDFHNEEIRCLGHMDEMGKVH